MRQIARVVFIFREMEAGSHEDKWPLIVETFAPGIGVAAFVKSAFQKTSTSTQLKGAPPPASA